MSIYPTLRYDDPTAAIDFLTSALGLTEEQVAGDDGSAEHAELSWNDGVVMLGTRSDPPGQFDPTGRAVIFVSMEEFDPHHDRAATAGARIVYGLTDQPYGSREYAALDTEGNV